MFKTKTKIGFCIGGYLIGQTIGSETINILYQYSINDFNVKFQTVRDLYISKKDNLTEDERLRFESRINSVYDSLKEQVDYYKNRPTIFIINGVGRYKVMRKLVKGYIKTLELIESDLNGEIIDAEVVKD